MTDLLDTKKTTKVWEKIDELPVQNWEDFHKLFARQVVEKKVVKKKEEKPVKVQSIKILDSKRSQNVGILIKSLNLEIEMVKQAIFEFDLSVINQEVLEKILEIVRLKRRFWKIPTNPYFKNTKDSSSFLQKATPDESEALKGAVESCPDVPLDKPDQ